MKRAVVLLLTLIVLLSAIACASESAKPEPAGATATAETAAGTETKADPEAVTETETQTAETAETKETEENVSTFTEAALRELFDQNVNCVMNLFEVGTLQYSGASADGLHKVTDPRFKDYAALEDYVLTTYTADTAKALLNRERAGHKLYVNVNGELFFDEAGYAPRGYFVDWSHYALKIDSLTADRCDFTVTASVTEPAAQPQAEPYVKTGTAVCENGVWLLTQEIL